jgi:hypothetical protein
MNIRSMVSAILLFTGMERAEASNLVTLTCPDSSGKVVFLLNLDSYSVVSATDKSYGRNRLMFGGVPISAKETELLWVWKDDHTDLGNGPIKGVRRTYSLDRNTLEMKLDIDIGSQHYLHQYQCYLSRRML